MVLGVGLSAAIWAMLNASAHARALFPDQPEIADPDRLVDDLTSVLVNGLFGPTR